MTKQAQVLTALLVPAIALTAIAGSISDPPWLRLTMVSIAAVLILLILFGLLRIIRRRHQSGE